MPTRFPAVSTLWSHRAEWNTGPSKDPRPGAAGTRGSDSRPAQTTTVRQLYAPVVVSTDHRWASASHHIDRTSVPSRRYGARPSSSTASVRYSRISSPGAKTADHSARGLSRVPGAVDRLRSRMFWDMEQGLAARRAVPGFIDRLRATALGHLAQQVPDESLRAVLTPGYEIGCKRVLLSDDYYPAVASSTVTVVPAALREVHGSTVVAEDGSEHELDVLVLATGFESTRPPWAERVVGRDGRTLAEHWDAGMSAYASTSVHGFPNLFVINGPQASLGHNSAVFMIETQIEHVLGALEHVRSSGVLEVSRTAEEEYSAWLDEAGEGTVWRTGGCTSWYRDDRNGRLTLLWPDFAFTFRERFGTFDPAGYAGAGSVLG